MFNTTFNGNGPTWSNACVGENGLSGNREYAKGYSLAANILLDKVLEAGQLTDLVDQVVYPICFNMRHSIELRLKETVCYLFRLSEYRERIPDFDLDSSHNIGQIWGYIKENAVELDRRYLDYLNRIDSTIADIAEVDPTGQTFRYPTSNESHKHLVDVALINLHILKLSFSALEGLLNELERFNSLILNEYSQQTYTRNLSRALLFDLAKALPERGSWKESAFKGIKAQLQKQYNLSSNELGKAIRKIECHPELSFYIKKSHDLLGLQSDDLIVVISLWDKLHDAKSLNKWLDQESFGGITEQPSYEDCQRYHGLREQVYTECQSLLILDKVAGLRSLFYLSRDCDYSEAYSAIFKGEMKNPGILPEELQKSLMHILDKSNGFQMIVTSLYWIGQVTLAEELVTAYSISENHEWLVNCRDRSRFSAHSLLKYNLRE